MDDRKTCKNCFFSICFNAEHDLYLCDLHADSVKGCGWCRSWEDAQDWKKVPKHEDPEHNNR